MYAVFIKKAIPQTFRLDNQGVNIPGINIDVFYLIGAIWLQCRFREGYFYVFFQAFTRKKTPLWEKTHRDMARSGRERI